MIISKTSIRIDVHGGIHTSVEELEKMALARLTELLGVDDSKVALSMLSDVEFDIISDKEEKVQQGDIEGSFPTYIGTLHARVRSGEGGGFYSGGLF